MKIETVLILGAGAAGLAAASKLARTGISLIILEARDHAGGRISTEHTNWPQPIEAGPEFIHGDVPEFDALLEQSGVQTKEVPDRHWRVVDGKPREIPFDSVWEKIFAPMEKYRGEDISFMDFLDRQCADVTPDERTAAIEYVEGFNAADAREVSLFWLRKSEAEVGSGDETSVRRIVSGYDRITQTLLDAVHGCKFRYGARAKSVHWQPGHVEVEVAHPSEKFSADAAIITLPLGVLRLPPASGDGIQFSPELPDKRKACTQLRMGSIVKVLLWFREPPWNIDTLTPGFLHVSGETFMTWWPLDETLMVTGWSGGPSATAISTLSDDAILETALANFAQGIGVDIRHLRDRLIDSRVFNWQRDPLARGAYSYAAVGGSDAADALAAPVANTLYFAGEATEAALTATVGGAIRSGYRAAQQLIDSCDLASP